jgi:hypothetical protein
MRRSSLAWVLSLLLLLVQHGAVLHEISHLSQESVAAGANLHPDGQARDVGSCPTCHAFSQVANPVASTCTGPSVSLVTSLCVAHPGYGIVGTDAPPPRSRGPPQV